MCFDVKMKELRRLMSTNKWNEELYGLRQTGASAMHRNSEECWDLQLASKFIERRYLFQKRSKSFMQLVVCI